MQKWEYDVKSGMAHTTPSRAMMNDMGRKGWELVAVENGVGYFKRPNREERPIEELRKEALDEIEALKKKALGE